MRTFCFKQLLPLLWVVILISLSSNTFAQPAARFTKLTAAASADSSNIESIRCKMVVPAGRYILAESFFADYDNVVKRMAFLERHGFEKVTFIHSDCQDFDFEAGLYAVIIHGPVSNRTALYPEMFKAQEKAKREDINLITTRIIHCRR